MNKKKLFIIMFIVVFSATFIFAGSVAYYSSTINSNININTGNAVFNITGFTDEVTKVISLKEGYLMPGDSGSFNLHFDATDSDVDMYVTLSIDKGTLPTNLNFYTTSDHKSRLYKYYEFMDTSNQSKDITIYWYWDPFVDDDEDNRFINGTDLTATVNVSAVQVSEYAMMKNGFSGKTEFWSDTYRPYIRTIKFDNDLSNLPSSCTGESDLCFDVSYDSSQSKKVYAYLLDSGIDYTDNESVSHDLYNLYIVSEAPIFAPSDCSNMFSGFSNLISIDFNNNFNTSNVTNMRGFFGNCSSLVNLDLTSFNTSNVTDLAFMFSGCSFLVNLDLSSFNTSNVTNMWSMFLNCSSLTSLDLSSFNTSKVSNLVWMFQLCQSLTSLDLSSFNTSNVTVMTNMFYGCSSLTSLDLSNFNTSSVTDMQNMFESCSSLKSLDVSNFNTSNVTNMSNMFGSCSSLTSLDLSKFNTVNVTDMGSMFASCSSLTSLDLSTFNIVNVTNMNGMFSGCSKLKTTINIVSAGVTDYGNMFYNAATNGGALITVNYIADASTLVDNMIATKSGSSNVVKGSQL